MNVVAYRWAQQPSLVIVKNNIQRSRSKSTVIAKKSTRKLCREKKCKERVTRRDFRYLTEKRFHLEIRENCKCSGNKPQNLLLEFFLKPKHTPLSQRKLVAGSFQLWFDVNVMSRGFSSNSVIPEKCYHCLFTKSARKNFIKIFLYVSGTRCFKGIFNEIFFIHFDERLGT